MNHPSKAGRGARALFYLSILMLGGCATKLDKLDVNPPAAAAPSTVRSQSVLIRNVTDARVFQDAPAQPGTPSLTEDMGLAPSALKVRAIGQGRGEAGNVLLPEGKTVDGLVRQTLTNVFRGLGYGVETDEGNVSSNDIMIDVTIDKFWGWDDTEGGGVAGNLSTTLELTGPLGKRSVRTVEVTARHRTGGAKPEEWQTLYRMLLEEYASEARQALGNLPQP